MMLLICGLLFLSALASLFCAVLVHVKHPRIALAFEGAAISCVFCMLQAAAAMHGLTNGG